MNFVYLEDEKVYPTKVLCVGRNYTEHIKELNNKNPEEIVLFIKPNSSITTQLIHPQKNCRYEGEISFIFKDRKIAGVGFGLDLTLVDEQKRLKEKGLPWEKAKAFDNSAVFSKFVKIKKEDIQKIKMELWINGNPKQKGDITQMIYKPDEIINEIKKYFSINNYDILMAGTPAGVGSFKKGDNFVGKIFLGEELLLEEKWTVK
ncbi:fumarylacetoacetate hydrolase family protein [Persephonella sp.]